MLQAEGLLPLNSVSFDPVHELDRLLLSLWDLSFLCCKGQWLSSRIPEANLSSDILVGFGAGQSDFLCLSVLGSNKTRLVPEPASWSWG